MTWMEDRFFTYRTEFEPPRLGQGQRLWFVSKGIDYQYEIRFNGHLLAAGEGMFSPVEIDLTEYLEPSNRLEVVIFPIPKRHPEPADRTQASDVVKPAVGYGWDWHPRLVPLGIWDDTGLQVRNRIPRGGAACLATHSTTTCRGADLRIEAEGRECGGCQSDWELLDPEGHPAARAGARPGSALPPGWNTPGCGGRTTTGNPCYTLRATACSTHKARNSNAWNSRSASAG